MFVSSVVWTIIELLVAVGVILIIFFKWRYQYWVQRGIKTLSPAIPFGNLPKPFKNSLTIGLHVQELYKNIRANNLNYGGIYFFATPLLIITKLDIIKNVLIKDFEYFTDRGQYYNERDDPLSAHLFALDGLRWRNLRTKMTPTFTTGKLRIMFQSLIECENGLRETMLKFYEKREPIDIKDVLARFTTDVIGSCAFGLDCKSFEDEESPFRRHGREIFTSNLLRRLQITFGISAPNVARALRMRFFPKEVTEFFRKIVKDTVEYRKKNNVSRNDFLQLLIELKNDGVDKIENDDGKPLTMDEIAAQCFVFFAAGFETSSTTMTFALYELAKNQDIQEKLRHEIKKILAQHENEITYEAINEMTYLTQVIEETLRKHPPAPFFTRQAVKDYKVPGEDIIIEKGVKVIISVYGIHHDPEYYESPEIFDPDRFRRENKSHRHPLSYIPFGEGPRICIGLRFGLMQSKVGLISLLRDYKFTVNKKTQEPLEMSKGFILAAEGEIWLNAERIIT